ncbi:MAG: GNAT family N-acetyltransferase [Candidatus Thorarchaeota archaeon]
MILGKVDGKVLRFATQEDLSYIDQITIICYRPIHESWVSYQGADIAEGLSAPGVSWEERKTKQNHDLFAEHPDWLWVLEENNTPIGFVSFVMLPDRKLGIIENNGVLPSHAGKGLGKFMYRHVLQYMRKNGMRFAFLETGMDDAHIPARKAYEAVGFDRKFPNMYYWQNLEENKPESFPNHESDSEA